MDNTAPSTVTSSIESKRATRARSVPLYNSEKLTPVVLGKQFVTLYVGPERKQITLHKTLLCSRSQFFACAFLSRFKEAQNNTMEMPEDDPFAVTSLVNYLYRGIIPPHDRTIDEWANQRALESVYILAEKLCISDLMDHIINAMPPSSQQEKIRTYVKCSIHYIYNHTHEESKLRLYAAAFCFHYLKKHSVKVQLEMKRDLLFSDDNAENCSSFFADIFHYQDQRQTENETRFLEGEDPLPSDEYRTCEFHVHEIDGDCPHSPIATWKRTQLLAWTKAKVLSAEVLGQDTITVRTIEVRKKTTEYAVHKSLLFNQIPFLNASSDFFELFDDNLLVFKHCRSRSMDVLIDYIYRGHIPQYPKSTNITWEKDKHFRTYVFDMVSSYCLAEKLGHNQFMNQIMDNICACLRGLPVEWLILKDANVVSIGKVAGFIYRNTSPGSRLRRYAALDSAHILTSDGKLDRSRKSTRKRVIETVKYVPDLRADISGLNSGIPKKDLIHFETRFPPPGFDWCYFHVHDAGEICPFANFSSRSIK